MVATVVGEAAVEWWAGQGTAVGGARRELTAAAMATVGRGGSAGRRRGPSAHCRRCRRRPGPRLRPAPAYRPQLIRSPIAMKFMTGRGSIIDIIAARRG